VTKQGGTSFNFVTEGFEAALDQARQAAGDKDVAVAGGANVVQQYLAAGLLDELQIHVVPVLLGGGVRLFADDADTVGLENIRAIQSPSVTHLKYRVLK
jgi:dihydrofolate reductase